MVASCIANLPSLSSSELPTSHRSAHEYHNFARPIVELPYTDWQFAAPDNSDLTDRLERGQVLCFPQLAFTLSEQEQALLGPELVGPKRKNISFNIDRDRINGVADPTNEAAVRALLKRYYQHTRNLVETLLPEYRGKLLEPVNSLRVHEISQWQGKSSWRKDDIRLHVDAFPSRPIHGQRIIRVFHNINPHGTLRVWRVGEPFERLAERLLPRIKPYSSLSSSLQAALKITKSKRSHYDHLILGLHDAMKADTDYQANGQQWQLDFHPGTTWMAFSDQTPHAAMSGQYMLEQTFLLDVASQKNSELSPLRVLERLTGRALL